MLMTIEKTSDSDQPKMVICPTCGGNSVYTPANPFRPFCSRRCQTTDMGAWANEDFRMPTTGLPEDQKTDDEQ